MLKYWGGLTRGAPLYYSQYYCIPLHKRACTYIWRCMYLYMIENKMHRYFSILIVNVFSSNPTEDSFDHLPPRLAVVPQPWPRQWLPVITPLTKRHKPWLCLTVHICSFSAMASRTQQTALTSSLLLWLLCHNLGLGSGFLYTGPARH